MHGKIKVFVIWRHPIYGGYARLVKSNILTLDERAKVLRELRKKHPGIKFTWFVEWKTPKQLKAQKRFAELVSKY